ncbi:DNA cytosine methyltransferase [Mariniblastus sp.]|nr:DNA cytosine methyltransferase [Mariniblastus sp.]
MQSSQNKTRIPVVDIFAGPGGLGEGFARYPFAKPAEPKFQICLSIEKDERAHKTLRLRSFTRQFLDGIPSNYYRQLKRTDLLQAERIDEIYQKHPLQAQLADDDALCLELGNSEHQSRSESALRSKVNNVRDWVLLGGPPCQAYSLVGRSRNRGIADYEAEQDHRHFLYLEYLSVIANHLPSVFVMENVKGLLSATVKSELIFDKIVSDLREPRKCLGISKRKPKGVKPTYRLYALTQSKDSQQTMLIDVTDEVDRIDFVIRMEQFGIPQARHRLIILGIREDLAVEKLPELLQPREPVSSISVLEDLPALRSGLSKELDAEDSWKKRVVEATKTDWFKQLNNGSTELRRLIKSSARSLAKADLDRGGEWLQHKTGSGHLKRWYHDRKIGGVFNHDTRGHIAADLHRYLFASCYATVNGASPSLKDFPTALLPNHKNVKQALGGSLFSDRFRVQVANKPSTTITSHISKDGHYYIHPDPTQCRSLTVREAARLQTFPDNYFFCGPRTSQYTQVGNAVPPYLAHQIAKIVHKVLEVTGVVKDD